MPNKIKFLFIPIIIDEKKDLKIFNDNQIFDEWIYHDLKSFVLNRICLLTNRRS